jgi:hypothetical protein
MRRMGYVDADLAGAGDPDTDAATPTPLHCQLYQVDSGPLNFELHTATFHQPRNTALRTGTKLAEQAKHLRSLLVTPADSFTHCPTSFVVLRSGCLRLLSAYLYSL